MSRLGTSWTILRHAFAVLRRNKRLLIFPLFSGLTAIAMLAFFLVPVLFNVTEAEVWYSIWHPLEAMRAMTSSMDAWTAALQAHNEAVAAHEIAAESIGPISWNVPYLGLAGFYLLSMFVTTFLNVAFFSQIIQALNGGRVSVSGGFALAITKLPAIAVWTLFSGTVGLILRSILARIGFIAQWFVAILGVSLSAASVFVVPVLINEQKTRNPIDYLKISANLVKRVWGEGLIGLGSGILVLLLVGMVGVLALIAGIALSIATDMWGFTIAAGLLYVCIWCVPPAMGKIFKCGLYLYATEGVAPGSFDENDFKRAWIVSKHS